MGKSVVCLSRDVTISNELGLHARAAAQIADLAKQAQAKVWLLKDDVKADAASIIDILTLAGSKGSIVNVTIEQAADQGVLEAIIALVENGFGE